MKRILALLLSLCLLVTALPVSAFAETEAEPPSADTPAADTELTVEGTDDFGNLLTDSIEEAEEEQAQAETSGYAITDLTFSGNVATVTYDTREDAHLVVAVYTEDGLQMLASGTTLVEADTTTAVVTLEGEMPAYFLAKAYLADSYDFAPLCSEYTTSLYTESMQALLDSTADDYDADRVLLLDTGRETNFAVYAESTRQITAQADRNLLTDRGDGTYLVTNADESFTSLAAGDVFAYETDEETLIVKVAAITVDGSTVTITEDPNLEMEDVFSQVKLDSTATTSQFTVDETTGSDGVTLVDAAADRAALSARAYEGDDAFTAAKSFALDKTFGSDKNNVKIQGRLDLTISAAFAYYLALDQQYVKLTLDTRVSGNLSADGVITDARVELMTLGWKIGVGKTYVRLGVTPTIAPTFGAAFDLHFTYHQGFGFDYTVGGTLNNLCTDPDFDTTIELAGYFQLNFDFNPNFEVKLLNLTIVSAKLTTALGLRMDGEMSGTNWGTVDEGVEQHGCADCVSGSITFVPNVQLSLELLWGEPVARPIWNIPYKLSDYHYSFDYDEFSLSACPHRAFKVSLKVYSEAGAAQQGAKVTVGDAVETNEHGVAEFWLKGGDHIAYVEWPNGHERTQDFNVSSAGTIVVPYNALQAQTDNIFAATNPEDVATYGPLVDSGSIKNRGNELGTWSVHTSGTLVLRIHGPMDDRICTDYDFYKYHNSISQVIIVPGATSVGAVCADMPLLESVVIPEGVQLLYNTFQNCENLRYVTLPSSLRSLDGTFAYCPNLEMTEIPQGVTTMHLTFTECDSLRSMIVPESVTSLYGDFDACPNLETVELRCPVSRLNRAFRSCKSLREIKLPDTLTTVMNYDFGGCDSLKTLTLPASVQTIEEDAFFGTNLDTLLFEGDMPDMADGVLPADEILYPYGNTTWTEAGMQAATMYPDETVWRPYSYDENGELVVYEPVSHELASGTLGDNLTWQVRDNHTLIISGEGPMPDFAYSYNNADRPWLNDPNTTSIESIVLSPGVTSIGDYAFASMSLLKQVTMADTVTEIGNSAFYSCGALETVNWSQNLTAIGDSAFYNCAKMTSLDLPESLRTVGMEAFSSCRGLTDVVLPDGLSTIGEGAFRGCTGLRSIALPDSLTVLEDSMFLYCTSLETIDMPKNLATISAEIVGENCLQLYQLIFHGDPPYIDYLAFPDNVWAQLIAYYPQDNTAWTPEAIAMTGMTCIPYTLDEAGNLQPLPSAALAVEPAATAETARAAHSAPAPDEEPALLQPEDETFSAPAARAAVSGIYGTTDTGEQTATFTGLRPGSDYLLLVMADLKADDPLAPDNLLYINQGTADETGRLDFTYRPRTELDTTYVVACGPSTRDLADAEITLPDLYADGTAQAVQPTVVYDGKTLAEGTDYLLTGQTTATEPGSYTCTLRGIHNYTGTVTLTYTLQERPPEITSSVYTIADGWLYLPAPVTAEALLPDLLGADLRITDASGTALTGTRPVGTGARLAQGSADAELTVVLYGDLDGNGSISTADLLQLRRSILNVVRLEGAYLKAATAYSGNDKPGTTDLLQLRRTLLGVAVTAAAA